MTKPNSKSNRGNNRGNKTLTPAKSVNMNPRTTRTSTLTDPNTSSLNKSKAVPVNSPDAHVKLEDQDDSISVTEVDDNKAPTPKIKLKDTCPCLLVDTMLPL